MQKLPASTFSAAQKDALLNQVKIIVDAGEITLRTDSDRAIRYSSRVRRSSHQLRLDDWKRLGRDQMGQKCGRGWQGLRGACKRVPKGGDKEAAIKASKVALADKIRKKKGLRDRNVPKVSAAKKVNPLSKDQQRILGNDLNHFLGTGRGFLDSDRGDGPSQRRRESLRKAVESNDTDAIGRLAKQIYYSSSGGSENTQEFKTTKNYVKAFTTHALVTFADQPDPSLPKSRVVNEPKAQIVAPSNGSLVNEDRQRILKNDLNHFLGMGVGNMGTDRNDETSKRNRESLKKAVESNDTKALESMALKIYFGSVTGHPSQFVYPNNYVKAFTKHALEKYSTRSDSSTPDQQTSRVRRLNR